MPISKDITITQFGIIAWDGKNWVLPSNQIEYNSGVLDQQTFIEWYGIPGAKITTASPATDPQNWAGSKSKEPFKQKWFYIGIDSDGKEWKGEAVINFVSETE